MSQLRNMSIKEDIFAAIMTIFLIWTWIVCSVIQLYIYQKPNGMKTLLDRCILDALKFYLIFCSQICTQFLCMYTFRIELTAIQSLFWYVLFVIILQFCMLYLICTIIVKYLSIFYPSAFADSDFTDKEILTQIRFFICGAVLIIFILDFSFIIDLDTTALYQKMMKNRGEVPKRGFLALHRFLGVFCAVLLIFVLFQIEKSGYKEENSSKNLHRFGFFTILFIFVMAISANIGFDDVVIIGAIVFSALFAILPTLYIFNSPNLRNYIVDKISATLLYFTNLC